MHDTPVAEDMIIPCQKRLFAMDNDVTYLNCAYLSPLLVSSQNAGIAGLRRKAEPWKMGAEFFFDECEQFREVMGQLIRCSGDHIAITPSASYGLAVAAKSLAHTVEAGDKVLVLGEQFPSNYYVWNELVQQKGASLTIVPVPKDGNWTQAILNHIDSRTKILALPNCHWTDGTLVDLVAIRAAIGTPGKAPHLVLDLTQSIGAYPFDIPSVQPDFMAAAMYKWGMCPYGLGVLYAAEQHWEGEPIEYNWVNRKRSENLARLVDYCDEYQIGARRFDVGERSNPILLPMAVAAVRQLVDWNPARTSATIRLLTDHLAKAAESLPLTTAPHRAGHMIGLHLGERWPDTLRAKILEANIHVSYRSTGMRVSPHLYNTIEEVDVLVDFLRKHL